jgi:subtilase family serine protease
MCGSVYLLVAMDTTNQVTETDEMNNVASTPVKVTCPECTYNLEP